MIFTLSKNKLTWRIGFWFGISLGLVAGLMLMAKLTLSEKTDYAQIKYKICHDQPLSPEELVQIAELLLKSDNVNLTDLHQIREYLCGNKKDNHFPDENFLAKLLGTKDIHRVKESIKKKTKSWQQKINSHNPDIGYNRKTGKLVLKNPLNGKTVETNLIFDSFIPK